VQLIARKETAAHHLQPTRRPENSSKNHLFLIKQAFSGRREGFLKHDLQSAILTLGGKGRPIRASAAVERGLLEHDLHPRMAQLAPGLRRAREGTTNGQAKSCSNYDASFVNGIELFVDGGTAQI
jgi:hypothetical protein